MGGGGQAYFGKTPKFSRFLIMTPPLNMVAKLTLTQLSPRLLLFWRGETSQLLVLRLKLEFDKKTE